MNVNTFRQVLYRIKLSRRVQGQRHAQMLFQIFSCFIENNYNYNYNNYIQIGLQHVWIIL